MSVTQEYEFIIFIVHVACRDAPNLAYITRFIWLPIKKKTTRTAIEIRIVFVENVDEFRRIMQTKSKKGPTNKHFNAESMKYSKRIKIYAHLNFRFDITVTR